MIKGLIFDLDGVLVDTKDPHFIALNKALKKSNAKNIISYNDHVNIYDGLPTGEKIRILNQKKIISKKMNKVVMMNKQKFTLQLLKKKLNITRIYIIFFQK